jgi:hypothetical protein
MAQSVGNNLEPNLPSLRGRDLHSILECFQNMLKKKWPAAVNGCKAINGYLNVNLDLH